ncbi:hypothetical protein [Sedimenticola selenatireducens]|jgi:hypothetical protein|uniref:Uncharacterized protein n=1 Tax=Sedimenticola selenatireducens TaxID=191960 RepID=A0A558DRS3_9GAMM|nr:hypothetical protein [Sedimenticola selenatireducens]MCW8882034.1 hypothetical protein [Sedimenticola sp.]MCW8949415.1 hypothetical protein [Sedimenticola sp.]MDF1528438.1 hypothetical protein [Sedimenticola sp.]TVO75878.1 hypothetical protein FHP88_07720 [Sedimenticola selenatireducens]TVT63737.1 MAG: hypothetical protein FHK78_10420 [Sedimenticola selenatireducens]
MRREIVVFNVLSVLVTLGISAVLFSYAAIPEEKRLAASQPKPMEDFADVDLGADFGQIPVVDLVGYYLENPPVKATGSAPVKRHFGGC